MKSQRSRACSFTIILHLAGLSYLNRAMYNYATNNTASPTNTSSSGYSDHSSGWWGSSSTPSSATSVSSGEGSNACIPRTFGQSQIYMPNIRQTQFAVPQTSSGRPPHAPYRYVALSTQYVYAAPQRTPMLARVSIVDYRGNVLYDTFVQPTNQIADFRTSVTGLLPEHLCSAGALSASAVREQVSALLNDKIVIGHSLWIHFSLLGRTHPAIETRDVALYLPFHRSVSSFSVTPLKSLVSHLMRRKIVRSHEHPLEEARATLDLFRSSEDPWEDEIRAGGWPCALPPSSFSRYFS